MALMVKMGSELIRYNPSSQRFEYSTTNGSLWCGRTGKLSIGNVKSLIEFNGELICCTDKGVYYSVTKGGSWCARNTMNRDFIDLIDSGDEIIANTSDGHVYYSTTKGSLWCKRR